MKLCLYERTNEDIYNLHSYFSITYIPLYLDTPLHDLRHFHTILIVTHYTSYKTSYTINTLIVNNF